MTETVIEYFLSNPGNTGGLCQQRGQLGLQIGGEPGIGLGGHFNR